MADTRVGKSTRRQKAQSGARKSRAVEDRKTADQERVLSDDERLDEFRRSFFQSVLPDLPKIPGYHVCWLTTTNPRDSIQSRVRLGYEPIKEEDCPGWEYAALKTGEYAGCIGVNEMVAFKLPMHLYEAYMREVHHEAPLAEEEKLTAVIDVIREQAASAAKSGSRGIKIELEEGMDELGVDRDPGSFAESLGESTGSDY